MLGFLKKLRYGARVLLSQHGGTPETLDLHGRAVSMMHAGSGPTFVYLHSALGEAIRWLPFMQSWSKQYRVLVPLHPGFGASGGFEHIDSIEDMAFHYLELFDALGLDEVILGGCSLGGWIAAEFACRWPERVKKLWLCGAPGLWVEEEPLPDLFRVMQDRPKLRELLFHDPKGPMATLLLPDQSDDEGLKHGYQAMTVLARLIWERPYDPKLARRLHRIACPTLLVWGKHDRLVPPAYAEAYRKYLPQAQVRLLENCGHLPMFEQEAEFVRTIAEFGSAD